MWQPIETAPRDGTVVDLWMVDETGRGFRQADAYYVLDAYDSAIRYDAEQRRWVGGRRDGWWAPNHDYDGQDCFCDKVRTFNSHPMQQKWIFTEPTHWMPLPEPPK